MNLGQLSSLFKNNSNSGGFTIPGNNAFADSMNDTIQDLSDAFARGGFVRGYADGGDPTTMDDRFAPVTVDRFAPMIDALQAGAFASQGANSADFKGTAGMDAANRGAVPLPVARNTTDAPVADDDDDAAATTPAVATPTAGISQPAPNGTANAGLAQPAPASSDSGSSWWTPNLRAGLLSAGLGMLASRSPFLGVAVGEGGLQGLKTYGEAEAADTKSKQDAIKQKMDERRLEFEAQRIQQTAQAQQFSQATSPLIRGPDGKMMTNPAYIAEKTAEAGIKDKVPVGYRETKDGNYEAIPGGPADPAVLKAAAEAKRVANAVLDDDTIHDMAGQYLAGDRTVMQNLGRGAQGAENIVKLRQEIAKQAREAGVDPKGIVNKFNEQAGALAGQRAVGTRAANISLAANEANNMIPIALAASDKLPRTQFMPWNQMVQSVQKGMSSPELASFVAATNSLVNSYVRAVSPSGVPTDSMRQHAYDMLNAAQGPEAYKAVIATMKQEMDAALRAPSQVQEELRRGTSAPTAVPTEVPQQGAVPTGAVGRRTDTSGREWYVDGAGKPLALVSP
jgi:hypothetical protein